LSTIVSLYRWIAGFLYLSAACTAVIASTLFFEAPRYDPPFKAVMRGLFRLLGIPVEVRGAERIRPGQAYLYMSNHVSLFDPPLLGGFLPGLVRGVEWEAHFRWPIYGLLLRRIGVIPIDRDNALSSWKSMIVARRRLGDGQSLVILPEAHRTMDGKLRPFKRMPFMLAREAGVDLVPVGLSGLYALKNKHSWLIRRSRLKVSIGEPITAAHARSLAPDELSREMRRRIELLIERP
jgi:1-acyl-sn-glycerol-3-phosphate acyltransferase